MSLYIVPVVLQLAGVAVILMEIFVPSLGLLSVMAGALFFYSLYLVFTTISQEAGFLFLVMDMILLPIIFYLGLKALGASSLSLKRELSSRDGVVSQSSDLNSWMGKTGNALTDLRPSGAALIQDKRLDVVTDGDYVDAGTPIRVMSISGNRIVVEIIE
ncbi:MAG: serine protease [Desulfamplus sp.]|nr:serine protease [Desulfamplus sp.]